MEKKHIITLSDHTLRIERILHIGGMSSDLSLASDLEEFFEEFDPDESPWLFGEIPEHVMDFLDEKEFPEEFVSWLHLKRKTGYLVMFGTPLMRHFGDRSNYSWGSYYTSWFYAETVEDAIPQAIEWAEGIRLGEKTKV